MTQAIANGLLAYIAVMLTYIYLVIIKEKKQ
jgi:hypothetical protein